MQAWFASTHDVTTTGMGGAVCQCVRMPEPGSVGEQDAWLWEALGVMRETCQAIVNEQLEEARKRG